LEPLRASIRVLIALDIGASIRLEACRAQVSGLAPDENIRHKGRAPGHFQFDPPPLRLLQQIEPIEVAGHRTSPQVEILLFDFGGISVGYSLPVAGSLEDLIGLSSTLGEPKALYQHAMGIARRLLELIGEHVERPALAEVSESYLVFQLPARAGVDPRDFVRGQAADVARLLRSEPLALSEQEIQEALSGAVSFGPGDLAQLDWNAALLVDDEPEDVVSVLEFANLQLLEMRFLDGQLDRRLDRAYEAMQALRGWRRLRASLSTPPGMQAIAEMQVDGAVLFERVSNTLKLIGDQYLARVYRTATQRFRLGEWNTSILRKLDTLESMYQKMQDQAAALRMEVLEWIIILLIALSIVLPFLGVGVK
jgi:hypothetical protein